LEPILEVPAAVDVLEDVAFEDAAVETTDDAAVETTDDAAVETTDDAAVETTDDATDSTDGTVDSTDDATDDAATDEVSLLVVVQAANMVITIMSASRTTSTFLFM